MSGKIPEQKPADDTAPPKVTKEAIAAERAERVQACGQALQTVLDQYSCQIVAAPQIVEGRIVATPQIMDRT